MFKLQKYALQSALNHTALQLAIDGLKNYMGCDENDTLTILRVGRKVLGKAWYHETDELYSLVGIEIEFEVKYHFMKEAQKDVGVVGIWQGKASPTSPTIFTESGGAFGQAMKFDNGYGDSFTVGKVIEPVGTFSLNEL